MTVTWIDYIYGCYIEGYELAEAYLKPESCEDEKCSPEDPCECCESLIYENLFSLWLGMKYRDGENAFEDLKESPLEIPNLPGSLVIRRFPMDYYGRDGHAGAFVIGILIYEQPSNHDGSFIKVCDEDEIRVEFAELRDQIPVLKGKSPKCYFIPNDCNCCS